MENLDFNLTGVKYVIHRQPQVSWKMDKVCYEREYILVIAMEGKAFYTIGEEVIVAEKNDVFIFPPGTVRSAKADSENPWEFISVNFTLDANDEGKEFFNKTILNKDESKLRGRFLEIVRCWTGKNRLYQLKCKNLVSEILYQLILEHLPETATPHMHRMEEAKVYIQENFREKISVSELAGKAGFSESYFRKMFKDVFGDAPMNYITKLRVLAASDLLVSGEANVTQAAMLSGFDDIYYFSRLFKQHMGMSPTAYVKLHSEK